MNNKSLKPNLLSAQMRPTLQLPKSGLWGAALIVIVVLIMLAGIALLLSRSAGSSAFGQGCVGVITINGEIVADGSPASVFSAGQQSSEDIAKLVEDASKRDDVKSILVVINSPGGSVVGSREIYSALKGVKKPKVAYFREVAASGGYYAAMGTDYIVSEPDALTGSIGVRATVSDMSGLFSKIGYNETSIQSGELKDIGTYSRPMTEKERGIFEGIINETFNEFKDVVVQGRGSRLDMNAFETQVLDARVLTGRQAYKIGMVDQLGSKKDAIAKASALAGSSESLPLCEFAPKQPGILSQLFSGAMEAIVPKMGMPFWKLTY